MGHFLLWWWWIVGVDLLVSGFRLRSGCELKFDFELNLGCDYGSGLWVADLQC